MLDPYAYVEFIYDFDEDAWIKTLVTGGAELHVWSRVVPELYFQWNHKTGPSSGADVRGLGMVVSLYLR